MDSRMTTLSSQIWRQMRRVRSIDGHWRKVVCPILSGPKILGHVVAGHGYPRRMLWCAALGHVNEQGFVNRLSLGVVCFQDFEDVFIRSQRSFISMARGMRGDRDFQGEIWRIKMSPQ